MRRRALLAAAIVISAVAATVVLVGRRAGDAHARPRFCTLIGCLDQVSVDMEAAPYLAEEVVAIRFCVRGRCRRIARASVAAGLPVPHALRRRGAEVSLESQLLTASGRTVRSDRVVVPVLRQTPNGEGCGVCWSAGAKMTRTGALVKGGPSLTASARGIDVLSLGRAVHAADPRAALPLIPGGDIELRSRASLGLVSVRYGDRVRRVWDARRDGGVTQAMVGVPPGRRICRLSQVTIVSKLRGRVRAYAVPVRTRGIARTVGLTATNVCGA